MRHQTRVYWLIKNPRGQTMAEYALILVTIAVVAAALVQTAGTNIMGLITAVIKLF
jgi:Flp pilus assembly pilin Flp